MDEYTQNILAKEFDVSKSSIYEYIRLNNLIDDLLVLVDSRQNKNQNSSFSFVFSKWKSRCDISIFL